MQAYVADCSHRFTVTNDEDEDPEAKPINECDYYPWDQNCASDPGGCWEAGQGCIRTCSGPCNTCQSACATGCDQCKAVCADGSAECIRKCAESRLECRDACMTAIERCRGTDCANKERECNAAFSIKRKQKCPECTKIRQCFETEHPGEDDTFEACKREFPRVHKDCLDWCWDYYEEDEP